MDKEDQFKKRILELYRTAYERDIVTFSDFLDLNEQHMVHSLSRVLQGVSLQWSGGYEMSERQMIAFLPDALSYEWNFPICCLHIKPKSLKYSEVLTHRDYLGALLNLGIDRSKTGDILIQEDFSAYVFCEVRIAEYIQMELCCVKHTNIVICKVPAPELAVTRKEEEITGTVASVRLDAVISLAFQSSRNSMIPLIEGGKVFVNGKMVTSNGYALKEGDVISVRGKGKFRFGGSENKTKKGRYVVRIYRYS
ncbi:MAG: YlmH/Sll1252 family protein [Lachnospiraceae bacterium]|nr:YlmH/Sll1252 family protein [Lachnospiraceae bacterium]